MRLMGILPGVSSWKQHSEQYSKSKGCHLPQDGHLCLMKLRVMMNMMTAARFKVKAAAPHKDKVSANGMNVLKNFLKSVFKIFCFIVFILIPPLFS